MRQLEEATLTLSRNLHTQLALYLERWAKQGVTINKGALDNPSNREGFEINPNQRNTKTGYTPTGALSRSISTTIQAWDEASSLKSEIGSNLEYAKWAEDGTIKQGMVGYKYLQGAALLTKAMAPKIAESIGVKVR
jgi:hypothetical protein